MQQLGCVSGQFQYMKSIPSTIYDRSYYLNVCLGSEQFKRSKGRKIHPNLIRLLKDLPITSETTVLDMGCGRGDIALYLARKAKRVIGIDYSKDAIELAKQAEKHFPSAIRKKTSFARMNVKRLAFPENTFDLVISIDVLEHLHKNEVEQAMKELSRVIKNDGMLFLHTGPNAWLYNYVYRFYVHPINTLLTQIDQRIKGITYQPLPKEPRIAEEKEQHVNEPTYFYLRELFNRHRFIGKIHTEIGFLKQGNSLRTRFYNLVTTLYPLSKLFPLNLLFGWVFIARLTNSKR